MVSGAAPNVQVRLPPGMTPAQMEELRRKITADAERAGMTVPQFLEHLKKSQAAQQQQQGQPAGAQAHSHPPQQFPPPQRTIAPGPPNPVAIAVAKFLRCQNLKVRTSILNGERKDMFRVKRALRALQSPAYEKARQKDVLLPVVTDRASLENVFKLLPLSMLALRVQKVDPNADHGHDHGHSHGKSKRIKGLWEVRIEPQQDAKDDMYYIWLWEDSRVKVKRQLYAALALVVIFIVVLYPLWPLKLRQGVYYLTWGLLTLLGLFFLMAIFRVILFCITYFAVPPGLWLFPNLWEEVSFLDSFRPVFAWHELTKKKKKRGKSVGSASFQGPFSAAAGQPLLQQPQMMGAQSDAGS